jgi:hypothetical protein
MWKDSIRMMLGIILRIVEFYVRHSAMVLFISMYGMYVQLFFMSFRKMHLKPFDWPFLCPFVFSLVGPVSRVSKVVRDHESLLTQ